MGARQALRIAKAAELDRVRGQIRGAREARHDSSLPGLLAWETRIASVPEWPIDARSLRLAGLYVLIPLRGAFQSVPWVAVVALVAVIGWRLAGWKLALLVSGFVTFIALTGYWARASITAYMVFFSLLICVGFGLPLGIWASKTLARTTTELS